MSDAKQMKERLTQETIPTKVAISKFTSNTTQTGQLLTLKRIAGNLKKAKTNIFVASSQSNKMERPLALIVSTPTTSLQLLLRICTKRSCCSSITFSTPDIQDSNCILKMINSWIYLRQNAQPNLRLSNSEGWKMLLEK